MNVQKNRARVVIVSSPLCRGEGSRDVCACADARREADGLVAIRYQFIVAIFGDSDVRVRAQRVGGPVRPVQTNQRQIIHASCVIEGTVFFVFF